MVEEILHPIFQEYVGQCKTLGILMVVKKKETITVLDHFDAVLLVIVKDAEQPVVIEHLSYQNRPAAVHVVTKAQLDEWLLLGSNRKVVDWVYSGRVIFDRNNFLRNLRQQLRDFPLKDRKLKKGLEFAKLIRRYTKGKALFHHQHYLDAFNDVVHSLHHLARLAVIEKGFHPEITVWQQIKKLEPEIYKLYDELVNSEESLRKRLELLFLANEYLIHSRTRTGAAHIIEVLQTKEQWSFQEIQTHPELQLYSVDLELLIEYLVEKHVIETVSVREEERGIEHRYYKISK